jgi:DNA-binding response OmpR family regulator
MEPILVHPDPPPPELVQVLDLAGYRWKAASDEREAARLEPDAGWAALVVVAADPAGPDGPVAEAAFSFCRALRRPQDTPRPLLVLVAGTQLDALRDRAELFDDFCLHPFHPRELTARLAHLLHRTTSAPDDADLVEHGPLRLNTATYQAAIDGRPLDLTYMEYELLKYLAQHPGKVFTREVLLSRVWGYEYYGGARTVDVHIRRLRAKLGEEHAGLISTVRSVGYRFGHSRWE